MKFIKLTSDYGLEFYLNPEKILYMYNNNGNTSISLTDGMRKVTETPEEIMELINGSPKKVQLSKTINLDPDSCKGCIIVDDEELRKDINELYSLADRLKYFDNKYGIYPQEMVMILNELRLSLEEKIEENIKNCQHDFEYAGHGHKDDFYICKLCGKMEER